MIRMIDPAVVWRVELIREGVRKRWCTVLASGERDARDAGRSVLSHAEPVLPRDEIAVAPLFALAAVRMATHDAKHRIHWIYSEWPQAIAHDT